MGPPKQKPPRDTHDQKLRKYDYFEYRYDKTSRSYYQYNPYTGETIFGTDSNYMDRRKSMWAPTERNPSDSTVHTVMYAEFYQSRTWGRRHYHGWTTECRCFPMEVQLEKAATHIAAVYRGFAAREAMKRYYRLRYDKRLCNFSGYYYYYDKFNEDPEVETSWYKPLLAFPDDILVYVPEDPDDYLQGDKYTNMGFEHGPYCKREGLKQSGLVRAEHIAFLKPNAWRAAAFTRPDQIDVEKYPLGSVVPFMDELKDLEYIISDYALVRSAICNNDWKRVLRCMHLHSDRILVQIYGLLSFAKTAVPLDKRAGILEVEAKEVFDLCIYLIDDPDRCIRQSHQVFALMCLQNMLSLRAGRAEYFNTENVTVQGARRAEAVEVFMNQRLRLLMSRLDSIEMDTTTFTSLEDGVKVTHTYVTPTQRGCDIAEYSMSCLSLLSQDPERRELMATECPGSIIRCIMKCNEENGIAKYGLAALYNFCYRCEVGQLEVLETGLTEGLIEFCKTNFSGDLDTMRNLRRLELSLVPGLGFRGNVEEIVEVEMKEKAERERPIERMSVMNLLESEEIKESDSKELAHFANALEKAVRFDDEKKADSKRSGGGRDEDKDELDSKADSKGSGSYAKSTHNAQSKARDMLDDDEISVRSDVTM